MKCIDLAFDFSRIIPTFPPHDFTSVSRAAVLSHLKTYNLYYEGQNLQLRHREVCTSSFLHDCLYFPAFLFILLSRSLIVS